MNARFCSLLHRHCEERERTTVSSVALAKEEAIPRSAGRTWVFSVKKCGFGMVLERLEEVMKKNEGPVVPHRDAMVAFVKQYAPWTFQGAVLQRQDRRNGSSLGERERIGSALFLPEDAHNELVRDGTITVVTIGGDKHRHGTTCPSAWVHAPWPMNMGLLGYEPFYASPWVALRHLLHEKERVLTVEVGKVRGLVGVADFIWVSALEDAAQVERTGFRLLAAKDAADALVHARREDARKARGMLHKLESLLDSQERVNEGRDLLLAVSARQRLAKLADQLEARGLLLSQEAYNLASYLDRQYAAVAQLHRAVNDILVPLQEGRDRERRWFAKQANHLDLLAEQAAEMVPISTARCIKHLPGEFTAASQVAGMIAHHATTDEARRVHRDTLAGWLGRVELSLRQALLRPELERIVSVASFALHAPPDNTESVQQLVYAELTSVLEQQLQNTDDARRDARFAQSVQADLLLRLTNARNAVLGDLKRAKQLVASAASLL